MTSNHQINGQETPRKFYAMVPNMVDEMGLSPYAFRLYVHFRRVIGEGDGACWQSTRTLAEICNMSTGSVSKAKRDLLDAGLIHIEKRSGDTGEYDHVTVVDVWAQNLAYFETRKAERSPGEQGKAKRSPDEHQRSGDEQERSPGERKKNQLRIPLQEEVPTGAKAPAEGEAQGNSEITTPTNFAEWKEILKETSNRPAVLRRMFETLYPDRESPDYGRFGQLARKAGGASVLALKMWEASTRPPVGCPLDYIEGTLKGQRRRRRPSNADATTVEQAQEYAKRQKRQTPPARQPALVGVQAPEDNLPLP